MADVLLVVALFTGLLAGFVAPSSSAIAFVLCALFLYFALIVEERGASSHIVMTLQDIGVYSFAVLAGTIVGSVAGFVVRHPVVLLYAFWLYMLIAAGFMVSRCCLGWHVGASVAVLTAFVAVGLFVQSFYGGGAAWLAALIMAAGLWWGADSWRRDNGLAIYE